MSQPVLYGPGNVEVQAIGYADGRTADYRVRRHGFQVLYNPPFYHGAGGRNPRTMSELATLVDLGTLKETPYDDADPAPDADPHGGQGDADAPGLDDARAA